MKVTPQVLPPQSASAELLKPTSILAVACVFGTPALGCMSGRRVKPGNLARPNCPERLLRASDSDGGNTMNCGDRFVSVIQSLSRPEFFSRLKCCTRLRCSHLQQYHAHLTKGNIIPFAGPSRLDFSPICRLNPNRRNPANRPNQNSCYPFFIRSSERVLPAENAVTRKNKDRYGINSQKE